MNAMLVSPPKKRLQSMLDHASGDKRFKILEVHMKRHQFRHDALIEVAALVTDYELTVLGDGVDVVVAS